MKENRTMLKTLKGWLLICALAYCCPGAHAQTKPNIVLIVADDLGYGDVACYGSSIQTPNLDRLAREGTRFTDFHSNGAVCSPTRCALMTGRYQQRAGIAGLVRGENGMSPDEFTIAKAMKSSGYVTGMFGKWHLGELPKFNPVQQGFDEYKGLLGGRIDYFTHQAAGKPHRLDWRNGVDSLEEKGYSTTLIADHSIDFIRRSKSKPFFLYVAFNSPHTPLQFPEATDGKYPEAYRKVAEWMDKETGRILAALKQEDLADNTFVFFFSDNGGHEGIQGCSNKPLRGFKGSFWEGGHREPAIARWPGHVPAGKVTDQTALGMDLMPTVMELAGATLPPDRMLDGISLVSLLLHEQPLPPRKLFWAQGKDWAMRDGPWKLLHEGGRRVFVRSGQRPWRTTRLVGTIPRTRQKYARGISGLGRGRRVRERPRIKGQETATKGVAMNPTPPSLKTNRKSNQIFRFKPGSPCEKLGIKPLDLSKVGSTVQDPPTAPQ